MKNFIVDRIVRGNMYDSKTGKLLWSLNQIQSPSLSMESETVDATDALGTPIMTFDRSKSCTLSGENAIFDISLLNCQVGNDGTVEAKTTIVPAFETFDVDSTGKVTLAHTPSESVKFIYVLNGDGSIGEAYSAGSTATETEFVQAAKVVTLPTAVTSGQVFISYDYEGTATEVVNNANSFPKSGRFVMEVLGRDVCDSTTEVFAMLVLPSAKLSASTDISFEAEMSQNFELKCSQDYCSKNNELFSLIIPEDGE